MGFHDKWKCGDVDRADSVRNRAVVGTRLPQFEGRSSALSFSGAAPQAPPVPAKKTAQKPLTGEALIKEVCRRIRFARTLWDAHRNAACRGERAKAIALYETLSKEER